MVHSREIQRIAAEAENLRFLAQEANARARRGLFAIILGQRVALVISHAAENAGVRFDAGQLADAGVQRIAAQRYQIAGDYRQMRSMLHARIHHLCQLLFIEEGAHVDVAQLQNAKPFKTGRQIRNWNIHFSHMEVSPLDERSVSYHRERSGKREIARGIERPPSRTVGWPVEMLADAPHGPASGQQKGRDNQIYKRRRAEHLRLPSRHIQEPRGIGEST